MHELTQMAQSTPPPPCEGACPTPSGARSLGATVTDPYSPSDLPEENLQVVLEARQGAANATLLGSVEVSTDSSTAQVTEAILAESQAMAAEDAPAESQS